MIQIQDRKWKYGRFVCMRNEKMQYNHYYINSSVIVDLAMGQISCSTERIFSVNYAKFAV